MSWPACAQRAWTSPCRCARPPGRERVFQVTDPDRPHCPALRLERARRPVTERFTIGMARPQHIRRPRTRRGWLITIAASGAILALKLTVGLGILALAVHLLTH